MHSPAVDTLIVLPDLRRKRVQLCTAPGTADNVRIEIDGTPYAAEGPVQGLLVEMGEFVAWSPDAPTLYTARCTATGAAARFGMRECTIKENRVHLNGRPLLLRGVVLCAADFEGRADAATVRGLVASLKGAGFNFARLRGVSAPVALLDAADELGMLLCDEVDAANAESAIAGRRNHPSIVMWHVVNATGPESALGLLHEYDPSRIAVTGLDAEDGRAHFVRPYQDGIERLGAVFANLAPPCSHRAERFYENAGDPGMPAALNAFGAQRGGIDLAAAREELERGLAEHEATGLFDGAGPLLTAIGKARADALRLQVQAARVNAKLAWYCVDTPPAGAPAELAQVQSPLLLAVRATRTNLVPREDVPVTVTLVNDERVEPMADLSLQVVGPTNQVLWKKKRSIKVQKQSREIWSGTISASGSVGVHKFVVRLMQGMKLLAQNSLDLHVVDAAAPCDVEVSVLDPHGEWTQRCTAPAKSAGSKPRLYIVPPLANTVRAYPDDGLVQVLNEVRAGAVALVFGPPSDWNDLAGRIDESLKATAVDARDAFHYVRLHPVFDGLPSRCLMAQPYRNVVPRRSFAEVSDERVCGSVALGADGVQWCEDMLVRRFGSGRIVFTHARVLEHLGSDPAANRLYANLLRHFGRRSVPGAITQPVHQTVLDWLRRERSERARLWDVIGPFPNWGGTGHETAFPPEQQVDLAAVHAGWRDPVRWTRWYALGEVRNEVDFDAALGLPFAGAASLIPETYYAYAECNAPARQQAVARVRTAGDIKVFANGALCHESAAQASDTTSREESAPITFKQGKNAVLIKLSRTLVPAAFAIELSSATRDPLILKWWR